MWSDTRGHVIRCVCVRVCACACVSVCGVMCCQIGDDTICDQIGDGMRSEMKIGRGDMGDDMWPDMRWQVIRSGMT